MRSVTSALGVKKLFIILLSSVILVSCFGNNSADIQEAKKAMLEGETPTSLEVSDTTEVETQDVSPAPQKSEFISMESLDEVSLIKFDALSESDIKDGEVEISGSTLDTVDKITVSFSNPDSDYPDDLYTLKTFKPGGETFKYLASSRFNVLDFGKNTYVFTAYSGKESSRERLVINLEDEKSKDPLTETNKLIGTEVSAELASLPTGGDYGNPVMLGESAFTYSDINGLEVEKTDVREISCENLTDYLSDNINTWFYWNTCRDLIKDKAITFYVLQLNGEEYVYQKHYVDFINSFYGSYDIETGTGVTKENIQEKNAEFKEKNDEFSNTSLIDGLFKDIVN